MVDCRWAAGAVRFGQLMQSLRRQQGLSVEKVAAETELSVGSVRAIEQGRRAPSEASGVRLLRALLPETKVSKEEPDGEVFPPLPTYSFIEPNSGALVRLLFQARTAGDNASWAQQRATRSKLEALATELFKDPARREALAAAGEQLAGNFAMVLELAERPARDAELGAIVRRLATVPARRIWTLETLLELWVRVDGGTASEYERDKEAQLNGFFNEFQITYRRPDESWD
nr:helix-turn-helix transcriptional regulator [Tessaracoccus coleopterorum]